MTGEKLCGPLKAFEDCWHQPPIAVVWLAGAREEPRTEGPLAPAIYPHLGEDGDYCTITELQSEQGA